MKLALKRQVVNAEPGHHTKHIQPGHHMDQLAMPGNVMSDTVAIKRLVSLQHRPAERMASLALDYMNVQLIHALLAHAMPANIQQLEILNTVSIKFVNAMHISECPVFSKQSPVTHLRRHHYDNRVNVNDDHGHHCKLFCNHVRFL